MNSIIPHHQTTAYTIVTPNYLAHAFSLKRSFLQHNPGCNFFICLVSRKEHLPQIENELLLIDDLIDSRIEGMIARYNPFELTCALKPFFARLIFDRFNETNRLIYLDADMQVFGTFIQQSSSSITLSPHRTANVNFLPGLDNFSTTDLLRYGIYNAGYFEVLRSEEGLQFLNWWQQLLEHHGYNLPEKHLFCDQLWLNAVHSFFADVFINKHPGYNVGFWNLIERKISVERGAWLVNKQPLVLFHFSNYKIEQADRLVNFDHPMLTFQNLPELLPVFETYKNGLIDAGYDTYKNLPYPFQYKKREQKKKWWQKLWK